MVLTIDSIFLLYVEKKSKWNPFHKLWNRLTGSDSVDEISSGKLALIGIQDLSE